MQIVSFIAKKLAGSGQVGLSSFVTRLSVIATAFSVAVMILTLAFVAGFQDAIAKKVYHFWGNIRVQEQGVSSDNFTAEISGKASDSIYKIIAQHPDVKQVDAYALKAGLLKSNTSIEGLFLKGVDVNFSVERMLPFLQDGKWMSVQTGSPEIVISAYTARILQLKVGDKAFVYFMSKDGNASRVRPVKVSGIYKTAIEEYDRSFAWIPLSFLQKISGADSLSISGYEVSLHDQGKEAKVAGSLMDALPVSWFATPLDQLYPNLFDWLNLQDVNRRMIIIIMCIVAVINLVSCLLILVLERSKMIGLLKAVGATDVQVQSIFWRQGIRIGFKGVIWGTALGLAIALIQQATGFIRLDESAYYIREAPVKLIWWQIVWVDIVTLLVCFLVLLLPSFLVRRIRPVEALRFD